MLFWEFILSDIWRFIGFIIILQILIDGFVRLTQVISDSIIKYKVSKYESRNKETT